MLSYFCVFLCSEFLVDAANREYFATVSVLSGTEYVASYWATGAGEFDVSRWILFCTFSLRVQLLFGVLYVQNCLCCDCSQIRAVFYVGFREMGKRTFHVVITEEYIMKCQVQICFSL